MAFLPLMSAAWDEIRPHLIFTETAPKVVIIVILHFFFLSECPVPKPASRGGVDERQSTSKYTMQIMPVAYSPLLSVVLGGGWLISGFFLQPGLGWVK